MQEYIRTEFRPPPVTLAATGMAVLEAVHLVMHRIHAQEIETELNDFPGDRADAVRKTPARVIARINREIGWSIVPLTAIIMRISKPRLRIETSIPTVEISLPGRVPSAASGPPEPRTSAWTARP